MSQTERAAWYAGTPLAITFPGATPSKFFELWLPQVLESRTDRARRRDGNLGYNDRPMNR